MVYLVKYLSKEFNNKVLDLVNHEGFCLYYGQNYHT